MAARGLPTRPPLDCLIVLPVPWPSFQGLRWASFGRRPSANGPKSGSKPPAKARAVWNRILVALGFRPKPASEAEPRTGSTIQQPNVGRVGSTLKQPKLLSRCGVHFWPDPAESGRHGAAHRARLHPSPHLAPLGRQKQRRAAHVLTRTYIRKLKSIF